MSYPVRNIQPSIVEKLLAGISYVFPMVAAALIIICALSKKDMKSFLKFHIYQSIFISILIFVCIYGLKLVMSFVNYIPFVKNVVSIITFYLNMPILFGFSIVTFLYFLFIIYLIMGALRGKYSFVPYITNIIRPLV